MKVNIATSKRNQLNLPDLKLEPRVMLEGSAVGSPEPAVDAVTFRNNPFEVNGPIDVSSDLQNTATPSANSSRSGSVNAASPVEELRTFQANPVGVELNSNAGSVEILNDSIRDSTSGAIPASTVEAFRADGEQLTGQGVGIGIVSDSFNALGGFEDAVASGDLPEDIDIVNESPSGSDEGRALAEIIFDIAPNADLSFSQPNIDFDADFLVDQSPLDLLVAGSLVDLEIASAINSLATLPGNKIIVDDIRSNLAPIYQQGFKAQAQERAIESGVSIFSSAGNEADAAVEVEFNGKAGDFVDFDPTVDGIQGLPVTYVQGESPFVVLQWDDPYQSVSPGSDLTADFDLVFIGSDSVIDNENPERNILTTPILAAGQEEGVLAGSSRDQLDAEGNITGRDPYEFYATPVTDPTGSGVSGQWHARLRAGDGENRTVRATFFNGDVPNLANDSTLSSTSRNANVVGAVDALTNSTADTSSSGFNTLLFDDDGNRLPQSEQIQVGPDFLAPAGFNTTFFGSDSAGDPDDLPNFPGTSAAAAASAAVNALLLEINPNLTPRDSTSILSSTADGRGVRDTAGAGLINAQSAVEETESRLDGRDPRESGTAFRERRRGNGRSNEQLRRLFGSLIRSLERRSNELAENGEFDADIALELRTLEQFVEDLEEFRET